MVGIHTIKIQLQKTFVHILFNFSFSKKKTNKKIKKKILIYKDNIMFFKFVNFIYFEKNMTNKIKYGSAPYTSVRLSSKTSIKFHTRHFSFNRCICLIYFWILSLEKINFNTTLVLSLF